MKKKKRKQQKKWTKAIIRLDRIASKIGKLSQRYVEECDVTDLRDIANFLEDISNECNDAINERAREKHQKLLTHALTESGKRFADDLIAEFERRHASMEDFPEEIDVPNEGG